MVLGGALGREEELDSDGATVEKEKPIRKEVGKCGEC